MEGPVLTESEVWKVGSETSTSINTNDRSIDYLPLMNDNITDENLSKASENPGTTVQEEICGSIQEQPDQEVTSDQIKSVIPHELRLEEDLSSSQTADESDEPPAAACKQERCVNQAEDPADKMCLASGLHNLDQEITILVTNHDCTLEDEEDEEFEEQKTSSCPVEPETVSSVEGGGATEEESLDGSIVVVNVIEVSQVQKTSVISHASTEQNTTTDEPRLPGDSGESSNETNSGSKGSSTPQKTDASSTGTNTKASLEVCSPKDQPTKPEDVEVKLLKKTKSAETKDAGRPLQDTLALTRSPGRTQHVQTQVSLEVMYQSVATSPMTPPEGSTTFLFPSTFGKLANKCSTEVAQTKDAELQVGLQVELRSVATAPMTPIVLTPPEVIPEPEPRVRVTPEEEVPEHVQEVSWDEKGMTWEVYGAVVEVTVLGSAIQKHLEKQVKKQKKQPLALLSPADALPANPTETSMTMPSSPPPTSDLGEISLAKGQSEEKTVQSGRRRQNNFRQWFRNIRRPSCCSRPRQDEEN
ncbi:G protein-regulated inducer of neurite outgrowth 1-like [Sinocyclocheilus anshuiensis]|uniref:G protein-regulated inducer of neurite outgrowth 1-like n=1 Tax=Sinocyclocheilus anshuiensis TaxID=1608454 RepID=UPI0007BA5AC4|nr:PREDICTED: G protein-regulated inducer of neurite outgrowth 1-like [Sinocyclocheilus anshuiensis]XP_016295495.1 PREDICTED: G protein-regulated inducer of neurite outgrowth 1-like [Sinocyclocheilus anshuiensis]XP_016295496.1 PREDICTED: G protein-regulated inducer of neurite outgrowth 1-like [Sinocyclocheilus anshuiensis]